MKYDFVVLGATGMQGRIVSRDLLENGYSVLLCGRDKPRVEQILNKYDKTSFQFVDIRDIHNALKVLKKSGSSVVVNCMEGDFNLTALQLSIKAGANCLDLGSEIWMTKEQFKLNDLLQRKELISITGCGSVPGIGNVMLTHAANKLDKVIDIEVGFSWDSNIKKFVVPFSIKSIIEEFTDPAPVVENKKFIKKTPLDSVIVDHHREIGKQKEFFVRHPETYTFYKYFKDKGVKNIRFYAGFPQHSFEKILAMIDLGFGSKEEIFFNGVKIAPVDFLTEVLKRIEVPKGYKEEENLWVKISGEKNREKKTILMECIVPTINGWHDAGCNIDTGMPASIMAQMVKNEIIKEKGSFAPEAIVPPEPFFKELRRRKMIVYESGRVIN
ncbi:saccharopine dehydrogenase NADP-binding domain-containing protein [Candidatus Woesearchaeota archaeon]|nr:saccharopine dehydrogenase NADP-binding domain-containing protein [Candidatus Woesearchaeota archaeon]